MWGPYGRTPYSRNYVTTEIHAVFVAATAKAVAKVTALRIVMVHVLATAKAVGKLVRKFPQKRILATAKATGRVQKEIRKPILAQAKAVAHVARQASFYRTVAATAKAVGSVKKEVRKTMLATAVAIASRLRLQRVIGWEFTGAFAPTDRIRVDTDSLTITLNGENVMHLMDGPFPFLGPGESILTYTDEEGARTVRIRVLWKGRWS